jgi:hypothetical protein
MSRFSVETPSSSSFFSNAVINICRYVDADISRIFKNIFRTVDFNDKRFVSTAGTKQTGYTNSKLTILHQNICSLQYKSTELEVLLCTELNHVDVIRITEHWLNYQNLKFTNIANFKLMSAFCKSSSKHGGSSIYVKGSIETRDISYFKAICEEKNF